LYDSGEGEKLKDLRGLAVVKFTRPEKRVKPSPGVRGVRDDWRVLSARARRRDALRIYCDRCRSFSIDGRDHGGG